jgi:hypothetical protein
LNHEGTKHTKKAEQETSEQEVTESTEIDLYVLLCDLCALLFKNIFFVSLVSLWFIFRPSFRVRAFA